MGRKTPTQIKADVAKDINKTVRKQSSDKLKTTRSDNRTKRYVARQQRLEASKKEVGKTNRTSIIATSASGAVASLGASASSMFQAANAKQPIYNILNGSGNSGTTNTRPDEENNSNGYQPDLVK